MSEEFLRGHVASPMLHRPHGFPALLEELNELGYDECKRLAALVEGVIGDECLEYYEGGIWLKDIYFARGQWAHGKPPGFTCYE